MTTTLQLHMDVAIIHYNYVYNTTIVHVTI